MSARSKCHKDLISLNIYLKRLAKSTAHGISPQNDVESVNKKDKKGREKYCLWVCKRETDREGR